MAIAISAKSIQDHRLSIKDATDVSLVDAVIEKEVEHMDSIPFYHVVSGDIYMFYEVATAFAMFNGYLREDHETIIMRPDARAFGDIPDMKRLLELAHHKGQKRGRAPDTSSDHLESHRSVAISATTCITSKSEAPPMDFASLVGNISGASPVNGFDICTQFFLNCLGDLDAAYRLASELADTWGSYDSYGFLVQGFVRKDMADKYLYPSAPYGHVLRDKKSDLPISALTWFNKQMSPDALVDQDTQWRYFADPMHAATGRLTAYVYAKDDYGGLPYRVNRRDTLHRFVEQIRATVNAITHPKTLTRMRSCFATWENARKWNTERRDRTAKSIQKYMNTTHTKSTIKSIIP